MATYSFLLLVFALGSIYHFKIRIECIYSPKLTKPRIIILITTPFIFLLIAYFGGNQLHYYILAFIGATFLISNVLGEGIHEKGIYYRGTWIVIPLILLAKWEDIEDLKFDISNNKLESFKYKTLRIYPGQYYRQKDVVEIKKLIENK